MNAKNIKVVTKPSGMPRGPSYDLKTILRLIEKKHGGIKSNKPGKIRARAPFVPLKKWFQWSRREFSVKVRALFPYRQSIPGFKIQALVSLAISWRQEGRRGVARKGAGQGVSGCSTILPRD